MLLCCLFAASSQGWLVETSQYKDFGPFATRMEAQQTAEPEIWLRLEQG